MTTLTTTLPSTTLPELNVIVSESTPTTQSAGGGETATGAASMDEVTSSAAFHSVVEYCAFLEVLLDPEQADCPSLMSTGTQSSRPALPPYESRASETDDDRLQSPTTNQEGSEEEEQEESSSQQPDEPPEEPSPNLLERLLDQIDEWVADLGVQVAGVQVLAATGIAVALLARLAAGLFLTGLGMVRLSKAKRRFPRWRG